MHVLKKAELKLNPAKCAFVQAKVKYLGHWFSGEGYGMDPKIVEAVRNFKEIKKMHAKLKAGWECVGTTVNSVKVMLTL